MAPSPRRLELHALLVELLGNAERVYFQPPSNVQMSYSAIVYSQDNAKTEFAGNRPYSRTKRYMLTVIGRDPDDVAEISDKIGQLPLTSFVRAYTVENLHHHVFNLYF